MKADQSPDEPLIYFVQSCSDHNVYHTVNLRNWVCSCESYKYRTQHYLSIGVPQQKASCKHLRFAFNQFSWTMLNVMRDMYDKQEKQGEWGA